MDVVAHSPPSPGEEGAPPNPKRMRLQYSSGRGDNNKNKACIILYCRIDETVCDDGIYRMISKMECNIFIIDDLKSDVVGRDYDDDGYARVSPTLQIDCGFIINEIPVTDAFCVLGETLYMFEGCADMVGKSIFAFDLTQSQALTEETRKLQKGGTLLKKINDMTFPKSAPVALPTPDGKKIVVFPTQDLLSARCVFELFEPANGSVEQLPSIIVEIDSDCIQAYGFMQDSKKLLVQFCYAGMYVLNLAEPDDKHWVKLDVIYKGVEHIPNSSDLPSFFETVDESGRFCFVNGDGFYDLEEFAGDYGPLDAALLSFDAPQEDLLSLIRRRPGLGYTELDSRVAHLNYDRERGECHFCHMLMDRPTIYIHYCRLAVTVCCVDLKSFKEVAEKLSLMERRLSYDLKCEKTSVVKTHKLSLGFGGRRQIYKPHLFFTF